MDEEVKVDYDLKGMLFCPSASLSVYLMFRIYGLLVLGFSFKDDSYIKVAQILGYFWVIR